MSELLSNDAGLARLHELVKDHPDFELVSAPAVDVYCFRYVPNCLADRQDEPEIQGLLDQLNQEIIEAVLRSSHALVKAIRIRGHVSISSVNTSAENVEAAFESIARWGRLLNKKLTVGQVTT